MSKEEKQQFCKVFHDIKVPDGYSRNISRCVNVAQAKITGLVATFIFLLLIIFFHKNISLQECFIATIYKNMVVITLLLPRSWLL
jgi:hypothetical protein